MNLSIKGIKICILAGADYPHARTWVDYFADRGAKVYLISLEKSIGTKGEEHIFSSRIKQKFIKYPFSSSKIAKLLREIKPDIINAHFVPNYGFISAIIGYKPLVITCLGSDILEPPKKDPLRRARIKFVLRKADLITTDGEVLLKGVMRYGIPKDRILNVPFGADTSVFKPLEKSSPPHKVVYFRRLEKNCNPELFVKALPAVLAKHNIKPIMLDRGSRRLYIRKLIKKLGIESKVEFLPFLTEQELAKLLGTSDIYVSTSLSDSTSVTLLEAMSCGVFPIVTDIAGNREWIKDGENGFLVPLSKPDYLANKILEAIKNPELRKKAMAKNISIIHKYGDRKKNLHIVESAFLKLIQNSR